MESFLESRELRVVGIIYSIIYFFFVFDGVDGLRFFSWKIFKWGF